MMKINKILGMGLMSCCMAAAITSCTDTWDDHYDGTVEGAKDGSLWQAITSNSELSNFASVIKATGFDKQLNSSQVFTVFAPTNDHFSAAEAEALIAQYQAEKGRVSDDDNSVLKEFVRNHVALYNYSVSPVKGNDSIVLMNGKYAVLNANDVDGNTLMTKNDLYKNGMLYVIDGKLTYFPNVFEYLRKDDDLKRMRNFFYCGDTLISEHSYPRFYYNDFDDQTSVAGGMDSLGRTVYLDSVFHQRNELFSVFGSRLNAEDSTYWMLAPTNELWDKLVKEYEPYFNYENNVQRLLKYGDRDSLQYFLPRYAIMSGAFFSRTPNKPAFAQQKGTGVLKDSLLSTTAPTDFNYRRSYWGADFNYYQYYNVWDEDGVMAVADQDVVNCSNGLVRKVSEWPISPLQTFMQYVIVEAENGNSITKVYKIASSSTDSTNVVNAVPRSVSNDNPYYGKLWNNRFIEFAPQVTTVNPWVEFGIRNVLSNVGYDIYLVTAPALAYDQNAAKQQRLPTTLRATLGYHDQTGKAVTKQLVSSVSTGDANLGYHPDSVNYIKLTSDKDYPEGFKFPVCSFGLNESVPQVTLKLETRVSSSANNVSQTRTMRIDCILLVPHGTLKLVDELPENVSVPQKYWGKSGVLMYPHGEQKYRWFYMPR